MAMGLLITVSVIFYAGMFITSFEYNLCYSSVISSISTEIKFLAKENDKEKINNYNLFLNDLPLHGYETNCEELQEEIKKYNGKST